MTFVKPPEFPQGLSCTAELPGFRGNFNREAEEVFSVPFLLFPSFFDFGGFAVPVGSSTWAACNRFTAAKPANACRHGRRLC
jgi:hypothetical protein